MRKKEMPIVLEDLIPFVCHRTSSTNFIKHLKNGISSKNHENNKWGEFGRMSGELVLNFGARTIRPPN